MCDRHASVRRWCLPLALGALAALAPASAGGVGGADLERSDRKAARLTLSYSVPARFGLDANRDGLVDYQDTAAEVRPSSWSVLLRLAGCRRTAMYRWTVNGRVVGPARTAACSWRLTLAREGSYAVRASERGGRRASATVLVQDWLVLGLGDSVAAGEGVPDGAGGRWQDASCHRSANAFGAQAARALEGSDARTSVTFVHVACSGATLDDVLARQIPVARTLVGSREVDAVILSAGANDLNFGPLALFCAAQPDCPNAPWGGAQGGPTLATLLPGWVAALPGRYGTLAAGLRSLAPPSRTYLPEYFDALHAADGSLCAQSAVVDGQHLEVTAAEAQWMLTNFLAPLNSAVTAAASTHGWRHVSGVESAFRPHGYCAAEPWIVRYEDSLLGQGDPNGTLHPNRPGHAAIAGLVSSSLRRDLYPGGRARRPA